MNTPEKEQVLIDSKLYTVESAESAEKAKAELHVADPEPGVFAEQLAKARLLPEGRTKQGPAPQDK